MKFVMKPGLAIMDRLTTPQAAALKGARQGLKREGR
jgi:hypothetical protein